MDEDFLGELFSSEGIRAEQIRLSRRASRRLRVLGIRNLCVIDYDENFGPYLRFYLTKKSTLYRQLSENPAFLADLLVLAKDMKEMLLRDGRSLLMLRPIDKKGLKLLLVETTREFSMNAREIIEEIIGKLQSSYSLDMISRLLEEVLIRED